MRISFCCYPPAFFPFAIILLSFCYPYAILLLSFCYPFAIPSFCYLLTIHLPSVLSFLLRLLVCKFLFFQVEIIFNGTVPLRMSWSMRGRCRRSSGFRWTKSFTGMLLWTFFNTVQVTVQTMMWDTIIIIIIIIII